MTPVADKSAPTAGPRARQAPSWLIRVVCDHFLHPDHIVPPAEFVSTFMEFSDHRIAQMGVKLNTVVVQVFVICYRACDTGI